MMEPEAEVSAIRDTIVSDKFQLQVESMSNPVTVQPTGGFGGHGGAVGGTGLAFLQQQKTVTLKEERSVKECLCGDCIPCGLWGGCGPPKKRYYLASPNSKEEQVFVLSEDSSCFQRHCFNRCRGFNVSARDARSQKELFRIVRDFECGASCLNLWAPFYGYFCEVCTNAFKARVELPDGTAVGYIEQKSTCLSIEFEISDRAHRPIYTFKTTLCDGCCRNPCWLFPCGLHPMCRWITGCSPVVAKLTRPGGENEEGSISWMYPGCVDACVCLKHEFQIDFPSNADVETRATLVGAAVLFESFFGTFHPIWSPFMAGY